MLKLKTTQYIFQLLLFTVAFFSDPDTSYQIAIAPLALLAGATALTTGAKVGFGIHQANKASKLEDQEQPRYETPKEIYNAVEAARYLTNLEGMPGQSEYEAMIEENTAETYERASNLARTPSEALAVLQRSTARENDQLRELKVKGAEFKANAVRNLSEANKTLAQYKDKEYQINELDPYLADMAAASALKGASINNIHSGISDISSLLSTMAYTQGMGGEGGGGGSRVGSGDLMDAYFIKQLMGANGGGTPIEDPYAGFVG